MAWFGAKSARTKAFVVQLAIVAGHGTKVFESSALWREF